MNNLKIFNNHEFGKIRIILDENNEPWFVGKDVAEILEYRNGSRDIKRHVDELDRKKEMVHDGNQLKETILINESGLYSLIFSSKMDKAREFKRWVTSEVLPTIRKHGAYMTDNVLERSIADPDFGIALLNSLKEERARRALAEAQNEKNKPKVLFADTVSASKRSCLMGELAKMISQEAIRQGKLDKKIGQNKLFAWMRNKGYLCKGGERRNQPKQAYVEQGLFEIKKGTRLDGQGNNVVTSTTKITGKGQIYFVNKFLG
ncbi:phage antirepressor Ant [Anaerococcus hydrogenalis]|uniref:Phage antirepressor protein n=1 Tax=Anaerococcus hydrogenalis ACS-025-V-Sch4 TaxID=879306 RepID=F0H2G1_9FIRM|nr:phage antirepressor Ant [Anaerococcus hydrogenalis]EGC83343.1 phage antirepressor protein [Anaerococcus hydrogenalis ACS-025-V-Sch4]